jgi:hypothetical protein
MPPDMPPEGIEPPPAPNVGPVASNRLIAMSVYVRMGPPQNWNGFAEVSTRRDG